MKSNQPESQPEFSAERSVANAFSGCLYAAFVVAASASMLLVNALLCLTIYAALPRYGNEDVASRIGQMFFFIAPVFLLIVEWNLLDRLQRLFRRGTT